MSDERNRPEGWDILKILPSLLILLTRAIPTYISFKLKAKKAGKIFEDELMVGGIDKRSACIMKKSYLESSKLLKHVLSKSSFR